MSMSAARRCSAAGEALHLLAQLLIDQLKMVFVELFDVWWRRARDRVCASQHRVHLCKNDLRLAGFGDDVDHAAALCECARFALVIGRRVENDRRGRNRRDGAHLADELVAVHGRHEDVADDQMGPFALDDGERLGTVGRLENAVSVKRQQGGQETSIDGAIFCDEDVCHARQHPRDVKAMNRDSTRSVMAMDSG